MIKLSLSFLFAAVVLNPAICKKKYDNEKSEFSKTEILIKYTWEVDEVCRNLYGYNSYYVRGGVNNTGVDYDKMQITFQADGTGTYRDENSIVHQAKWRFVSNDHRNMELSVSAPYPATYHWHLVEITDQALHNSTFVDNDILVSARYKPVQ